MEYTQNYKFRLPADSDIIDIGDIDENFINVDALIATLRSKVNYADFIGQFHEDCHDRVCAGTHIKPANSGKYLNCK